MQNRWASNSTFVLSLAVLALGTANVEARQTAATATKPESATLTGEQVLDKYVEVTGGKAAYEKLKTRRMKAAMEIPGAPVKPTMEIFQKAPNLHLQLVAIPEMGMEQSRGFDGKIAWSKDPMQGVRVLEGKEASAMKDETPFNVEIRWREVYKEAKNLGRKTIDGTDGYEIELTPKEGGNPTTSFYDATSFLLIHQTKTQETPQGKMTSKISMSDYKDVDGIKIPFTMTISGGPQKVIMKIQEVKHNEEMPDSKFAKPEGEDD